MRFLDRLKLALHNISQAKSRSILTVFIIFIVGMLISVIVLIGINFSNTLNKGMLDEFNKNGTNYNLNGEIKFVQQYGYETKPITSDEYEVYSSALKKHKNVVDRVFTQVSYISSNVQGYAPYYAFDFNHDFLSNKEDCLVKGRIWTKDDSNKSHIWASEEYIQSYFNTFGVLLNVGDQVVFGMGEEYSQHEFTIKGIYNYQPEKNNYYGLYESPFVIFDLTYIINNSNDYNMISQIQADYKAPDVSYNLSKVKKEMQSLVDEINSSFPIVEDNSGQKFYRVYNYFLDEIKYIMYARLIVVGVCIFFGFIVLLLSIGSIANSVIINLDKNRRFTGLLKAVGLKHNSIKSIVYIETSITIMAGIGLATAGVFAIKSVLKSLLDRFYLFAFGGEIKGIFEIPFYFPFALIGVFILMAIAFSRNGLRRVKKQDVISIISEVD